MYRNPRNGELKIVGSETDSNTVPADVLAQTLHKMQRLVLIAAAAQEGKQFEKRFKPTSSLRRKHLLRCSVPVAGSYAIPIQEVDEDAATAEVAPGALGKVYDMVDAIRHDAGRVRQVMPDQRWRVLMLKELLDAAPEEGDRWGIDISFETSAPLRIDYGLRREITKLQRVEQPEEEAGAVIGALQRIDFAEKRILIRHPTTECAIECSYMLEFESDLFESRLELVQVIGQVLRNADGNVVRVTDVSMIQPVNLAQFEISMIEGHGRKLILNPPLSVVPKLDEETQQVFVFDLEELDLHVAATTRSALHDDISNDVMFAWEQYALAPDDDLTPSALEFKQSLCQRIKEEPLGTKN